MGTAKTVAAVAATLAVLAASVLVPPQFSQLQDRQMTGRLHIEEDRFRPTVSAGAPNLLERLQVFDGGLDDEILTLAQPIGDDELELWTERFRTSRQSLVDEGLLDASLAEELANTEGWGDRTLYWDPAGDTAVSTIGVFQSTANEDGSSAHEGWVLFDETSGNPVAFLFGPADGEGDSASVALLDETDGITLSVEHVDEPPTADGETADPSVETIEPDRYAQWLAAQWGLALQAAKDDKEGNRFEVADTGISLTVNASRAPFAVDVTLGMPAESFTIVSEAKSSFDEELSDTVKN